MSMAFEPKRGTIPTRGEMSLNSMVDQFVESIREQFPNPTTDIPIQAPASTQNSKSGHPTAEHQSEKQPNKTIDEILASKIDHTLLKADATQDEIQRICEEA